MPIDLEWVKNYIREHLSATLTVKEIASAAKKHPSDISRAYRDRAGRTIKQEIDALLREKALELMSVNRSTAYQIRERLGFPTVRQYYRWVKRVFHISHTALCQRIQSGVLSNGERTSTKTVSRSSVFPNDVGVVAGGKRHQEL